MSANPYAAPGAEVRDIEVSSGSTALASRGSRLGAAIIDTLAVALVVGVPAGIIAGFGALGARGKIQYDELPVSAIVAAGVGAIILVAITWYLVHKNGQTIGKKMVGIKVVRSDGTRASVGRIFLLRNALFWVVGGIPYYNIGNVFSLVDTLLIFRASRQCLHDQVADTIVVEA